MSSFHLAALSVLLLFAIGCGSNSSSVNGPTPTPTPTPTAGTAVSVTIPVGAESLGNRAYAPDEISVDVGTTVTWVNTDSIAHTSTSNATGWNSGSIPAGRQFSFVFRTAGSFPYRCTIHPGMVGAVIVR